MGKKYVIPFSIGKHFFSVLGTLTFTIMNSMKSIQIHMLYTYYVFLTSSNACVYICICTFALQYMAIKINPRMRQIMDQEKERQKIVLRIGTQSSFNNNLFSVRIFQKENFCFETKNLPKRKFLL
jgi:hypothetical protein